MTMPILVQWVQVDGVLASVAVAQVIDPVPGASAMILVPLRRYSPKLNLPYLTIFLMAINCAVYLYAKLFTGLEQVTLFYGLTPAHATPLMWVTHLFIHGGVIHLVANLFFLYHFGMVVEQALGRVPFGVLYLLTGFCAAAVHVLGSWGSTTPLIGASGAIAGVLGLYVALFPAAEASLSLILGTWYVGTIEIDSKGVGVVWLVYQLLLMSLAGMGLADASIAYLAHLGGLGAGFVLGLGLRHLGIGVAIERQMHGLDASEEQPDPDLWISAGWLAKGIGATLLVLMIGASYQSWQERTTYTPAPAGAAITLPTAALSAESQGQVHALAVWSDLYTREDAALISYLPEEELVVAFNADSSRVALVGSAGLVRLIYVGDGKTIRTLQLPLQPYTEQITSLRLSPDGDHLALLVSQWLKPGQLYLYQVANDTLLPIAKEEAVILDFTYRNDGQLLVIVRDEAGGLAAQQVVDGRLAPAFTLPAATQFCGFSGNGAWLLLCYQSGIEFVAWTDSIELWDSWGGQHDRTRGLYAEVKYIKVANDGSQVLFQLEEKAPQLWQHANTPSFTAPPAIATSGKRVRYSDNLTLALAISKRGAVELFDARTGALLEVLSLRTFIFGPRIIEAHFSPDERFVITKSANRKIHLWGVIP